MPRVVNLYEAKTQLSTSGRAARPRDYHGQERRRQSPARPLGPLKRVRKPSGLLRISYIADVTADALSAVQGLSRS